MVRVNNKSQEESEIIKINPAMKRHFEVQEIFKSFELMEEEQREEEKEISEMTDEKLEEETNQTRTKTI
jgi:hypothetical protein